MRAQEGRLNWGSLRDLEENVQIRKGIRNFEVEAEHDGDFWFVSIYEIEDNRRRQLYVYKINHPRDEAGARERGWEIYRQRHLNG